MGFQSKTYSLSNEVVAAIEAARARGETPNQLLRRVLMIDAPVTRLVLDPDGPYDLIPPRGGLQGTVSVDPVTKSATVNVDSCATDLDATSPGMNPTTGKATTEVHRPLREKGDGKR